MYHNPIDALLHRIKRRIHLQTSGTLASKQRGEGFDFAEIMPYVEGMDAKRIFWKSFAKGVREPLVKSYYEEREINIAACALLGGTLRFGRPEEKLQKLIESLTILAFAAHQSANLFQGYCYSEKSRFATPPEKEIRAIEHFLKRVAAIDPLYTSLSMDEALEDLYKKIRKKSLLILLGDFLEMPDLRKLSQKHEVVVLIVRDRFEAEPTALGDTVVVDPETGEEAELLFDTKIAKAYRKRYEEHDAKLLHHLRRLGIRHRYIYTDEDPFWKLLRL